MIFSSTLVIGDRRAMSQGPDSRTIYGRLYLTVKF